MGFFFLKFCFFVFYVCLFQVAIVKYRLSSVNNDVRFLQHTHDVADGIRFLFDEKREQLSIDFENDQSVVVGHSCGAHMCGLFTLNASEFRLDTVPLQRFVGVQGIYDLKLYAKHFPEWVSELYLPWGEDQTKWISPSDIEEFDGDL